MAHLLASATIPRLRTGCGSGNTEQCRIGSSCNVAGDDDMRHHLVAMMIPKNGLKSHFFSKNGSYRTNKLNKQTQDKRSPGRYQHRMSVQKN